MASCACLISRWKKLGHSRLFGTCGLLPVKTSPYCESGFQCLLCRLSTIPRLRSVLVRLSALCAANSKCVFYPLFPVEGVPQEGRDCQTAPVSSVSSARMCAYSSSTRDPMHKYRYRLRFRYTLGLQWRHAHAQGRGGHLRIEIGNKQSRNG